MSLDKFLTYAGLRHPVIGAPSQDQVNSAVDSYLAQHPVKPGATEAEAAQIEANRVAIEALKQAGSGQNPPQKGVDYWTDADQESIVQDVIAALGTPVFGRVDADNNIILTGGLADGTYTVKYEDGEGNVTEIGTIDLGAPSVFDVPITWQIGVKLNKNDGTVEATNEAKYNASDAIPLVSGARYVVATTNDCYNKMSIVYYNDNDVFVGYQADVWASRECEPEEGQPASADLVIPAGATKIRLRQYEVWNTQGASTKFVTLTGTL